MSRYIYRFVWKQGWRWGYIAIALHKKSTSFYYFYKMINFFINKPKVLINLNNNKKNYRLKNKYKRRYKLLV